MRGWMAASFAAASTFSFPKMSLWLGIQTNVTRPEIELSVMSRVRILDTSGWVELLSDKVVNEVSESEMIKQKLEWEGEWSGEDGY